MKKYLIICATLLMAACSREEAIVTEEVVDEVVVEEPQPAEDPAEKVTYIEAKSEKTKASIDDATAAFTWNTGDKVAVYAGGYKISDDLSSTYDGQGSATFAFSGSEAFDDADRANFAVFPASLAYDGNGNLYASDVTASSLKVNLPASYTLAQVQGEVSPVPMIATNAPNGGLTFKNICALVRLTVNNISKDANTLKITFPGKKVQGEFTLSAVNPGSSAVVTANTSGADDTITITDLGISAFTSGLVISVPVPTGVASSLEYGDVVVGAYDANNQKIHSIATPIKDTPWVPTRLSAKKVTANLPVFSVAADKKVVFAPGNLQATLSEAVYTKTSGSYIGTQFWGAKSWSFAANQYTAIGKTAKNALSDPAEDDVVDLFSWIGESMAFTDGRKYGILKVVSTSGTSSFVGNTPESLLFDWASVMPSYPSGAYRTLSSSEWTYLLLTGGRSAKSRCVKVQLNGTLNGLVIFPDNYSYSEALAQFTTDYLNRTATAFDGVILSQVEWETLEKAGCAFLPATGSRGYSEGNVVLSEDELWYWTTTSKSSGGQVYSLWIHNGNIVAAQGTARYSGCAVRAARDVN